MVDIVTDTKFELLSIVTLIRKVRDGISIEELYRGAERKFYTLIELPGNNFNGHAVLDSVEFSSDDLKQCSLLILDRLILNSSANPYITLCVSEDSTLEEIKRRRNKLLHIFHPDRNSKSFADETKTQKINEAYEKIANKYNETSKPFRKTKIDIPVFYRYGKGACKARHKQFLIMVISFMVFIGLIVILYFL